MSKRILRAATAALLLSAAVATSAAIAGQDATRPVAFFDLETMAPAQWRAVEPSSSMRLLQMMVPGADDEDAELVVFFFGPGQGGDVDANVARWRSQFTGRDGGAVEPRIDTFEVSGMPVTVVELNGTYARAVGGREAEPEASQTLLAAVVATGRGSLFIQLHGPSGTVAAQRDGFDAFLRGLRPTGSD